MMDLLSLPLSPPYAVDDLFPGLVSPTKSHDVSTILKEVPSQVGNFDHLPNIVVDDDPDVAMLKCAYKEQNHLSQIPPSSSSVVRADENEMPISPSSSEASSTHEVVLVVADSKGRERELRGPNRNAIMAKLNRERKKKQLSHLEDEVRDLTDENGKLKRNQIELQNKVVSLEAEVDYLKGVLANQSELAELLNNIKATSLSFHSSIPSPISQNKRARPGNENAGTCTKKSRLHKTRSLKAMGPVCLDKGETHQRSALYQESLRERNATSQVISPSQVKGVCLHVKSKMVSLEFCASCSMRADAAFEHDKREKT